MCEACKPKLLQCNMIDRGRMYITMGNQTHYGNNPESYWRSFVYYMVDWIFRIQLRTECSYPASVCDCHFCSKDPDAFAPKEQGIGVLYLCSFSRYNSV